MNHRYEHVLFICVIWISLAGCGGSSNSPTSPKPEACAGIVVSGVLQDSLTSHPVSQGWVVLESGTQLATTQVYNLSPTQSVESDVDGAFRLCSPTISHPSAIVIIALDSSDKAYPPFVAPIAGDTNLGIVPMGGCRVTCGLDGQQQTSLPATITGVITSMPIAKTGSVVPQYSIGALDESTALWNLAMPIFNHSPSFTFDTVLSGCAGQVLFCTTYTFLLPSQKPVWSVKGGYLQNAGAPNYSIYAVADSAPSCNPSTDLVIHQQDGKSLLTGTPGVHLLAADINFTGCQ